jgi:hypothetical protein
MASNLARFSVRALLASNAVRMTVARQHSARKLAPAVTLASYYNKQSLSPVKRFYSSGEKLQKNQIEEKVLEILRNFDRVKENPAKPKVKFSKLKLK